MVMLSSMLVITSWVFAIWATVIYLNEKGHKGDIYFPDRVFLYTFRKMGFLWIAAFVTHFIGELIYWIYTR
jgi:hypothetical protein